MAIAVDMTYTVSGIDTYHKVCAQMGFAGGQHPAPGIVSHWVEVVEGAFVVHEVWESEEQFDEFLEGHLQPMSSALGTEQPEVHVRPVTSFRRPV
jgi:hypothetical protein